MRLLSNTTIQDLLRQLIRIPSVNPSLCPEEGYNEVKLAEFAVEWLTAHNVEAHIEYVQPDRPNVFAEIGDGDGLALCLCAHLDTVGTTGMEISPFEPSVEGNRVYGRGSCDMKAGLAAVMSSAAELAAAGTVKGKVILALVCDEEYKSIGAEHFVAHHQADACIITEPTDLKLVTAHKGFLWGNVTTKGRSAHGSRWDLGESAITKMGHLITAFDSFDTKTLRNRKEDLVGSASMHVSLINGGVGVSTYAPICEMHVERRILPSETTENVTSEMESVIKGLDENSCVDWYFERKATNCDPTAFIVQAVTASYEKVVGKKPELTGWDFWTDAAIFQQKGIPSVNIGPAGYGLHEPVEWVDFDSVVQNIDVLIYTAKRFLSE